jgi:hypothetical protein
MYSENIQLLKELIRVMVPAIYLGWSVVNTLVAREKGRDARIVLGFSLLFTPFLVYLWLIAVPLKTRPSKHLTTDQHLTKNP